MNTLRSICGQRALCIPALLASGACAASYVPFEATAITLQGAAAAPGEGVEVALGIGLTWIEVEVRNPGTVTLWVSMDGVTVTGADGREHGMVESATLNAVASELVAAHPGYRDATREMVSASFLADYSQPIGGTRAAGDRTTAVEPGERAHLLLHPVEYVRLDGTGITPFPAPFWSAGGRDGEGVELRVVVPVSWGRRWGRVEVVGRVGG